jgi:nitrogen-specific signal transduction histidine kinase
VSPEGTSGGLPAPPWDRLRERLLEQASARETAGDVAAATALRQTVEQWWNEQETWNTQVRDVLGIHHEINNALVGVRGNTQLMLMNPAGHPPGVREKLEVVLRESGRIQEATARLRDLKGVFGRTVHRPHPA